MRCLINEKAWERVKPTRSQAILFFQHTLTVAAVLAALQQKVHLAVVAAFGKIAPAQSTEEVKVQKRAKAVKGVYLAEFFPTVRSAVDLMTHLHGTGRDQPLIVVLVGDAPGVLDKPFRHRCIAKEFALVMDVVVQEVGISQT